MHRLISFAALSVAVAGCQSGEKSVGGDVLLSRGSSAQKENQQHANVGKKPPVGLAKDELTAKSAARLVVTSRAFADGAPIPATYSDYGEKSSPPLNIGDVPASAKSFVIIVDDPDALDPKPFVHWVLYNLPASVMNLRTGVPGTGQVRQLMNARQGMNSAGSTGYTGPHPPVGDPPHHYHFQVFALDAMLPLEQAANKSEVIAAARGHVLATGELVGTFEKP